MTDLKFEPTEYKISTITATGSVNTDVNLSLLFEHINIVKKESDDEGIIYAEFGSRKTETIHKGFSKKLDVAYRKVDKKKRFDNQVTLLYQHFDEKIGAKMQINTKVFKNGHIQMTGLKYIEQGNKSIDFIIKMLEKIHNEHTGDIITDISSLTNIDYKIRLINCDFRIGFEVKRDKLYKIIQYEYGVPCSFEPCIYPGCKIQYNYNIKNRKKDGICYCIGKCGGKGSGIGDSQCKKITIAVFQSGCIIITGGQSQEQIDEAYQFICQVISKHKNDIHKVLPILPFDIVNEKKKVYIKKSTISIA